MFCQLIFLVALLGLGHPQNQCVREVRSLKNELQVELRDVKETIKSTNHSVSREDVQELVEDKATKKDVLIIKDELTAGTNLMIGALDANQNSTLEGIHQLVRDKATKVDVMTLQKKVTKGNEMMTDTLLADQSAKRDELVELLSDIATKKDVRKRANEVIQALNFSVATGNKHIMETLLQILESQDGIKNATTLNNDVSLVPADQCVTREEVESVVRTEVQSVKREVESVQGDIQSLTRLVTDMQDNMEQLLQTLNNTSSVPTSPPTTECTCPDSTEETATDPLYTCNGTPGWKRVVFIDMTDTSYNCPPGLKLTEYSKRTCGRDHSQLHDCSSTTFSVGGSEYSQVCGRIRGYQVGSTLAFYGRSRQLNNEYVDGVSLTHGPDGGRQHIWTFAAGLTEEDYSFRNKLCPCDRSTVSSPPFVGDDYFCESGTDREWIGYGFHVVFFPNDPLWDGQGCSSTSTCCEFNNPPWFTKNLPNPTTDDIELRLCLYNDTPNSDVPLELIELYVQ